MCVYIYVSITRTNYKLTRQVKKQKMKKLIERRAQLMDNRTVDYKVDQLNKFNKDYFIEACQTCNIGNFCHFLQSVLEYSVDNKHGIRNYPGTTYLLDVQCYSIGKYNKSIMKLINENKQCNDNSDNNDNNTNNKNEKNEKNNVIDRMVQLWNELHPIITEDIRSYEIIDEWTREFDLFRRNNPDPKRLSEEQHKMFKYITSKLDNAKERKEFKLNVDLYIQRLNQEYKKSFNTKK